MVCVLIEMRAKLIAFLTQCRGDGLAATDAYEWEINFVFHESSCIQTKPSHCSSILNADTDDQCMKIHLEWKMSNE